MSQKSAIVIGAGPDRGLGAQLCRRFAGEGLHVLVAGRTREKLDAVVASIQGEGGSAEAVVSDATSESDTRALFDRAGEGLTLAIYNAGNNTPGRIEDMEADYFEQSWRVCCFGGFLFGREAVRRMKPQGGGTLLFTGASASLRGRAHFGAFNSSKGALRTLAQAMAKESNRRRQLALQRIDSALQRIEVDDYGYCVVCDEQIMADRLAADPGALLCIGCASKAEQP